MFSSTFPLHFHDRIMSQYRFWYNTWTRRTRCMNPKNIDDQEKQCPIFFYYLSGNLTGSKQILKSRNLTSSSVPSSSPPLPFSPLWSSHDSHVLVFRSENGVVNIYDSSKLNLENPKPRKALSNLTTPIHYLHFNHDSQLMVAISKTQELKLVRLNSSNRALHLRYPIYHLQPTTSLLWTKRLLRLTTAFPFHTSLSSPKGLFSSPLHPPFSALFEALDLLFLPQVHLPSCQVYSNLTQAMVVTAEFSPSSSQLVLGGGKGNLRVISLHHYASK